MDVGYLKCELCITVRTAAGKEREGEFRPLVVITEKEGRKACFGKALMEGRTAGRKDIEASRRIWYHTTKGWSFTCSHHFCLHEVEVSRAGSPSACLTYGLAEGRANSLNDSHWAANQNDEVEVKTVHGGCLKPGGRLCCFSVRGGVGGLGSDWRRDTSTPGIYNCPQSSRHTCRRGCVYQRMDEI